MWNIRNFARHDNNILNPRTNCFNPGNDNLLRYEFPLMQWLLAKPYMKSDENIASVRISLFILGAVTIFGFFMLCSYVIGTPIVATCTSSVIPPRKYPMASPPLSIYKPCTSLADKEKSSASFLELVISKTLQFHKLLSQLKIFARHPQNINTRL